MIAGGKMLSDLAAADPEFDARAFTDSLKGSIKVDVLFTP